MVLYTVTTEVYTCRSMGEESVVFSFCEKQLAQEHRLDERNG